MEISRNALIVLCVLGLLGLGVLVRASQIEQQHQKEQRQTDANRNCRIASSRTALAAAFIFAEGYIDAPHQDDQELHNGYALGLIDSIPVLPAHKGDPSIAETERVENNRRVVIYRLTPEAKAIQAAGCDALFPPN